MLDLYHVILTLSTQFAASELRRKCGTLHLNVTPHLCRGRKFYLGAELIKSIDPNEGEALRRGVEGHPSQNLGPPTFRPPRFEGQAQASCPPATIFRRLYALVHVHIGPLYWYTAAVIRHCHVVATCIFLHTFRM